MQKNNLSINLFWDVNYNSLDFEKSSKWVICRVLDRGGLSDWHELNKMYSTAQIIEAATTARYLSKLTVYWLHNIFNIPLTNFRCYNLMQSKQEHWIY